ncbi:PTS sugar transporter subunit IIC [Lactococcus cremoris]|uniref:PTS sugar transporter subunit IIC n=1 Tax=Lactococcus lactis subsp. cremoris TaxID=1359 RepID=UPI002FCB1DDD
MDKFEKWLNKTLMPLASKMNKNHFISALSEAFMRCMPLTLGIALLTIIGYFPVPAWVDFLNSIGLAQHFSAVIGAVTSALAIYVTYNFAYSYVNRHEYNGHTAGLLSIASLLMLMPQIISVPVVKNIPTEFPKSAVVDSVSNVEAFQTVYTGSTGLIVAIIIGFIVSLVYIQLSKRNLVIKLPAGVPPMVVDSLSPAIISMVIFCLMFGIRVGFSYTPFHDIFNFSTQLIQAPLTGAVANPWVLMGIFTFGNFLWFFGIHPNLIGGILNPLLLTMSYANIDAYAAGKPVPYLQMMIGFAVGTNAWGGSGNTYGLVISMFTAKSERYKQLLKLGAIPSIFNISEPLLFGLPMMLNPIFFIPLVFQPAILGTVALGLAKILNITNLNPMTALLPWTTPAPVRMAISGGLPFLIIFAICLVLNVLIYYPFFKVADNKALEEEKAAVELEGSETA